MKIINRVNAIVWKTLVWLVICAAFNVTVFAKGGKIHYHLPPKADSIVLNYINENNEFKSKKYIFYAVLREHNDTFTLIISDIKRKEFRDGFYVDMAAQNSNRFLQINGQHELPVVIGNFDYLLIYPEYHIYEDGHTSYNTPVIKYHSFFMKFTLFNDIIKYTDGGYSTE